MLYRELNLVFTCTNNVMYLYLVLINHVRRLAPNRRPVKINKQPYHIDSISSQSVIYLQIKYDIFKVPFFAGNICARGSLILQLIPRDSFKVVNPKKGLHSDLITLANRKRKNN